MAGSDFAKVDVGAWVEPPGGASVAKLEVGAWLDFAGSPLRRRQAQVVN